MGVNTGVNPPDDEASAPDDSYEARKADGRCTRHGCPDDAADDNGQCPRHRDESRARSRKSIAKLRRRRARARRCRICGAKSGRFRCLRCRLRKARGLPRKRPGVNTGVNKRAAVATRTRKHADGRTRYHGRTRRGQPTRAQNDEQDIASAIEAVNGGRAELGRVEALRDTGIGHRELAAARSEALSLIAMGRRFLEAVLVRGGWEEPDPVTDEE